MPEKVFLNNFFLLHYYIFLNESQNFILTGGQQGDLFYPFHLFLL